MIDAVFDLLTDCRAAYPRLAVGAIAAATIVVVSHLVVARSRPPRGRPTLAPGLVSRGLALVVVASVLALGGTALSDLLTDGALGGWALLAHATIGGVFLVAFALLALVRSAASRPGRCDRFGRLTRLSFWLLLGCGVVTGGSMMLATMPWLGGEPLELAIDVHRWGGLALVLAVIAYCHGLALDRLGRRSARP